MSEPGPVTVGIPVYNDPDGLRRSVASVLAQTWPGEVRVLIVDDGSTDATPEAIAELQHQHGDVVRTRRHPRNRGRPAARNTILESVEEGYLAWLDADDVWYPHKLAVQMEALRQAEPGPVLCASTVRVRQRERGRQVDKVPDVNGDQVRRVLEGRLPAYLFGLVGPVDAFRLAGRFDEELARRQDFELLLRFVARGGRVIAPATTDPLAEYRKSFAGRAAADVARASDRIWRRHRRLYLGQGPRFALRSRAGQHTLIARFWDANGRPGRARARRGRAAALRALAGLGARPDLQAATRGARRRGGRRLRRILANARVRRAGLAVLGTPARLTSALRRRGAARLPGWHMASRIGRAATDVLARGLARLLRVDAESLRHAMSTRADPAEDGSGDPLAAARRELDRGAPEAALAALAHAPAPPEERSSQRVLLARAQRLAGDPRAAMELARAGLREHPGESRLDAELRAAAAAERRWDVVIASWEQLSTEAAEQLGPWDHVRVMRALRERGELDRAWAVAERAQRRHTAHEGVAAERHRVRARRTRWSACLEPLPGAVPDEPSGEVTSLGFLADDRDAPVVGWVLADPGGREPVRLVVNAVEVVRTWPHAADRSALPSGAPEGAARFTLSAVELLEHLGAGDTVTFRLGERLLPVRGLGAGALVRTDEPSRAGLLHDRLAHGWVFTKLGRLRPPNTPERVAATLALFRDVAEVVRQAVDAPAFPFYGNLLGAVREHDIIAHDVGGFDMAYLAHGASPREVKAEQATVCLALTEAGYHVQVEPWCAMVRRRPGDAVFVDLNYAWFDAAGALGASYGWRYERVRDREAFEQLRPCPLAEETVLVPGNAEDVLVQLYGQDWQTPDQGFAPTTPLQRDERYLLTPDEQEALRARAPRGLQIRSRLDLDASAADG